MAENNIFFKGNFFEKGGITARTPYILFIVVLVMIQISISWKSGEVRIHNYQIKKEIDNLEKENHLLNVEKERFNSPIEVQEILADNGRFLNKGGPSNSFFLNKD